MNKIRLKIKKLNSVAENLVENRIDDKLCHPVEVVEITNYVALLESAIKGLMRDVVPHAKSMGHNAVDREMHEAIKAVSELKLI